MIIEHFHLENLVAIISFSVSIMLDIFGNCQEEVWFVSRVFVNHSLADVFKSFAPNDLHLWCLCYSLAPLYMN